MVTLLLAATINLLLDMMNQFHQYNLTSLLESPLDKLSLIHWYLAPGLLSTSHSTETLSPLFPITDPGSFINTGPSEIFLGF